MNRNTYIHTVAVAAFACAVGTAYAQVDNPPRSTAPEAAKTQEHHTAMADMSSMSGMHDMPATVTSVDHGSGIVEVESGNMKLKVHFPSSAIADLKKGDKITLHMGYSRQ